ncbi:carboxymuconolactone decarboxylase family protein [Pontibacter sp. BT310]|uniref:Alkyl hydroperoxide reductase AhpD n=1 Tax=Pontibacter populi TaxID=890055 RepID=A0ABS6XF56_9BACT|nr:MULTISPECIES: carboxymuconolactone decarboxylase family protein [Pontibacter]MBJ6119410.1 carboxymuconolactone decarboxylase family protein [Pontibacter sp. BT310]MBR0571838.1 carboxymuconolactone decarboxylase family protein [Microvirga sp. STS03]MBW3366264.1 carboxymuconolactone decarboxylase family protein [Pontibacter populi]
MLTATQETKTDLLRDLGLPEESNYQALEKLTETESRYLRDLRVNLKSALSGETLTLKEAYLLALSAAANEENDVLSKAFEEKAIENGADQGEVAEAIACASLLATNNILYRFRHYANKDVYEQQPARVKMNIMMKPVLGKEFFELMSLAISAINGCERCITSHEASIMQLGTTEPRIFDAIRIAAVVVGVSKIVR